MANQYRGKRPTDIKADLSTRGLSAAQSIAGQERRQPIQEQVKQQQAES